MAQAQMIERPIAMIDRYLPHMDALEHKLDRVIERACQGARLPSVGALDP